MNPNVPFAEEFHYQLAHRPIILGTLNETTVRLAADRALERGYPLDNHELFMLNQQVNQVAKTADKMHTDHYKRSVGENPRSNMRFINLA